MTPSLKYAVVERERRYLVAAIPDGVLLCSHHHHRAHDARYTTDLLPNGDVRFHRRT